SLAAALAVTVLEGHATRLLLLAGGLFVLGTLGAGLTVALLAGHPLPARLSRLPGGKWLQRPLAVLEQADSRLVRNPRLLLTATGLDLGIVLLDASTLWVLTLALGESPSWASVFAGFMLASVLRSVGVTPGGLGLFEAALITTLSWAGISVPVALSATLLFRGLSFWLPMLPGLLLARGATRNTTPTPAADDEPWWTWSPAQAFRQLAAAGQADPAQQLPLRPAGHDPGRRPRGPRVGTHPAPLEPARGAQRDGGVRPDQLAVRRADLRAAVLRGRRPAGAVSQRLVRGIAAHRTGDHLRGAHLQALLPQPPRPAAADQHPGGDAAHPAAALHPGGRLVRPGAPALAAAGGDPDPHPALRRHLRMGEAPSAGHRPPSDTGGAAASGAAVAAMNNPGCDGLPARGSRRTTG